MTTHNREDARTLDGSRMQLSQSESCDESYSPEDDIDDSENLGSHCNAAFLFGHVVDRNCFERLVRFSVSDNAKDETEAEYPDDTHDQGISSVGRYRGGFRCQHLGRVHRITRHARRRRWGYKRVVVWWLLPGHWAGLLVSLIGGA